MAKSPYGVSIPDNWSEFQMELYHFYNGNFLLDDPYRHPTPEGKFIRAQTAYTGEGRYTHFRRLAEMAFPKVFEWNEWSEKIARALCENNRNAICGCGGCVLGSTRIWNPITGESPTIQELTESNTTPIVMTLSGPELAEVPVLKGYEELFEVVLKSGRRFTSTAKHRVLTPFGYEFVGSLSIGSRLFGYEHTPHPTTSDIGPSVRGEGALRSRKKAASFQGDCHQVSCLCGEQLPSAIAADQSSPPSPDDAPTRSRSYCSLDAVASTALYTHGTIGFDHPSMPDSSDPDWKTNGIEEFPPCPENHEHVHHSSQPLSLSPLPRIHPWPSELLCPGFFRTPEGISDEEFHVDLAVFLSTAHRSSGASQFDSREGSIPEALGPHQWQENTWSYSAMVAEDEVVSITAAGHNAYYDITVPEAHHYFAEGAIHHNSSKSTTTGLYAFFWYICAPNSSAVLIASTTVEAAKKRIWKEIRKFYVEIVKQVRKLGDTVIVNSPKPAIRASQQDTAHGIYVVAVAKGEEQKGIDALKGFHPERLLMIGDETDSISQAVVDVGVNQEIGTIEYQTVWLGNDPSLFNPLGQMMQPAHGKAVGLGDTEWTSVKGYHCLRFDAFDSPNIRDKDKWKGIIRKKDIDSTVARFGENHPQVWIMLRGIHPPEGCESTVLSEALMTRYQTAAGVTWKRSFILSSVVDPAFGGDRCTYRVYMRGEDTTGKLRILCGEKIEIPISGNDPTNPAEYQISKKVRELNQARGIRPEEFDIDCTGTGRGSASNLQREWSPSINTCSFGGSPSDFPVSDEDPRPAKEAYDRKVTELWYSIREFVQADMIRGLDTETAQELCARRFEIKAKKISLESKEDMKLRGIASPDWGDNLAVYIHMLREKGIFASVMTEAKQEFTQDWSRKVKEYDLDGAGTYAPALDDAALSSYIY